MIFFGVDSRGHFTVCETFDSFVKIGFTSLIVTDICYCGWICLFAGLASQPLVPRPDGSPPQIAILCIQMAIFIEAGFSLPATPNYVEVHDLYPEYKFVTIDKCLDQFL